MMQYLTRKKETFASSSKTYQYLILNIYGIDRIILRFVYWIWLTWIKSLQEC